MLSDERPTPYVKRPMVALLRRSSTWHRLVARTLGIDYPSCGLLYGSGVFVFAGLRVRWFPVEYLAEHESVALLSIEGKWDRLYQALESLRLGLMAGRRLGPLSYPIALAQVVTHRLGLMNCAGSGYVFPGLDALCTALRLRNCGFPDNLMAVTALQLQAESSGRGVLEWLRLERC